MKTLIGIILITFAALAQSGPCRTQPGGKVCGGGAACTTSGVQPVAGSCKNIAPLGQSANCQCVAPTKPNTISIPLTVPSWYIDWPPESFSCTDQTFTALFNVNGALAFNWPRIDPFIPGQTQFNVGCSLYDYVSYVMTQPGVAPANLTGKSSITVSAQQVASDPARTFNYNLEPANTATLPTAEMHVILAAADWNSVDNHAVECTDSGAEYPTGGNFSITLAVNGTQTVTVPLDPGKWIFRVSGQLATSNLTDWQYILDHLYKVGVTFGGGSFYAHGVNVSGGPAQFQLSSFTIQ